MSYPLFRSDKAGGGHPGVSRFNRDPEPGGLGPFYGSDLLATTSLEPALWAVLISQKWLRRADRHIYSHASRIYLRSAARSVT